MEKEGRIMSEEKKNLTEEERKALKENLKKKIDEMSDEELNKVAGGAYLIDRPCFESRFAFTGEDVKKIKEKLNIQLDESKLYRKGELNKLGIPGNITEIKNYLKEKVGIIVEDSNY